MYNTTKIRALNLADAPTRFLIAHLYASQSLSAEAIEQLESLVTTLRVPAILQLLGDLYLKIDLHRLAEQRYSQAANLSKQDEDIEGQALSEHTLGQIYYEVFGNKREAIERLKQAAKLYRQLGDAKSVERIQQRITDLEK